MAEEDKIRREITEILQGHFGEWEVGITDKPKEKRKVLHEPEYWYQWDTGSTDKARHIMQDFLEIGCKESKETDDWGKVVYIKRAQ